jgi:hypothetical protein
MNPWGFLDGGDRTERGVRGTLPLGSDIAAALPALAGSAPADSVSIAAAPFYGTLAFVVTSSDGTRRRLDASGQALPSPNMARAAALLGGKQAELLLDGDSYYFAGRGEAARLPVYRVVADGARYYLDPVSGEIVRVADADDRWYRWLHEGLHQLDFTLALRRRSLRDLVMLPLMLGVTLVCATGTWLGLRRLLRQGVTARQ